MDEVCELRILDKDTRVGYFSTREVLCYFAMDVYVMISEICSWRWILDDLAKRLDEVVGVLDYECHAVCVVLERLKEEILWRSQDIQRPGPLKAVDDVDLALLKEYKMLKDQKLFFEKIRLEIDNKVLQTRKVKRRIVEDLQRKEHTIAVEEACLKLQFKGDRGNKKNRSAPLSRWKNHCESLKRDGLEALDSAFCTRDQVRLARMNLSVISQTDAVLVDAALRKRLHGNQSKLEELRWQEKESKQDLNILSEERLSNEKLVSEMLERLQLVEARISERKLRAPGEIVRDEVDNKLRREIGSLKRGVREFNNVISNITNLQQAIKICLTQINCCITDLTEVIELDKSRIKSRKIGDEEPKHDSTRVNNPADNFIQLSVITEEDECDDCFNNK